MNPKNVNDLDPKLKETYERVMGTSYPSTAPAAPESQPRPIQTTVVEQVQATPEPVMPMQPQPMPMEAPSAGTEMTASPQLPQTNVAFTGQTPEANTAKGTNPKKNSSLMPVLLVVGGLIFFVAYAVIWAKVFGLF